MFRDRSVTDAWVPRALAVLRIVAGYLFLQHGSAKLLGVPESDVMSIIESGELTAKKIGASYRIKRSAVDEYLAK